jgi:hypothetical protein
MAPKNDRLKIMVSSTVYGIEELLELVYALAEARTKSLRNAATSGCGFQNGRT